MNKNNKPNNSSIKFTLDGKKVDRNSLRNKNKLFIEKKQPHYSNVNTYNEELDNIKNIAIL